MAKWSFTSEGFTPVAVADTATFTTLGFMGLQGGSTTQRIDIWECFFSGLATTGAVTPLVLARDSTVATATIAALTTAQSNAPLDPSTAALAAPQIAFTTTSGTYPKRDATLSKINLGFNAFGGVVRWYALDPTETFKMLGNTASFGESSVSCYTGGSPGLVMGSIVYEPL